MKKRIIDSLKSLPEPSVIPPVIVQQLPIFLCSSVSRSTSCDCGNEKGGSVTTVYLKSVATDDVRRTMVGDIELLFHEGVHPEYVDAGKSFVPGQRYILMEVPK